MRNTLYEDVIRSLELYIDRYPGEEKIKNLLFKAQTDNSVISRENISGHITASGLAVRDDKLLLIFHKKLQRYLQPGGHLEGDATLVEAAQREVFEETGLRTTPFTTDKNETIIPIHIDIHTIPFNKIKGESEHQHYDCMFFLQLKKEEEIRIQELEVDGYKWVSLDHEFKDTGTVDAVKKINRVLKTNGH